MKRSDFVMIFTQSLAFYKFVFIPFDSRLHFLFRSLLRLDLHRNSYRGPWKHSVVSSVAVECEDSVCILCVYASILWRGANRRDHFDLWSNTRHRSARNTSRNPLVPKEPMCSDLSGRLRMAIARGLVRLRINFVHGVNEEDESHRHVSTHISCEDISCAASRK